MMKKFMRVLGIVMSTVIIVGIMAACTSNNTSGNNTSGSTSASAEKKPVSIRFLWWGTDVRHKATLAVIDMYQKAFPNVTIEGEYGGFDSYQDKLTTQLAGGTAPDLMQLSFTWPIDLQKKGGFFVDLSKYPKLIDLSMFPNSLIDGFGKVGNAVVAVPTGASAYGFIVNKNLLTKAGVPLNQKWTWDGFLDAAKKVHALGGDYYFSYDNRKVDLFQKYLRPYLEARTGQNMIKDDYSLGFTRDNLVEALSYIKTLNDNKAWPPVSEVSSAASLAEDPRWINGKIASSLSVWVSSVLPGAKAIGDAADVEIFPTLANGKDTAIASQPAQDFSVNARSANIEETIKFLNYLFTDEQALKILKDTRGVPVSKKGIEVAEANKLVDPIITKCLKLGLDNSTSIPYCPISDDSEIKNAGQDVIEMMLFGKLTPNAAADEMISRYNVLLREMKAGK